METTFIIDDADNLKQQLQRIHETLQSEWTAVTSAWQNLDATWDDNQYSKFVDHFEQLTNNYRTIESAIEQSTHQLSEQIQITQKHNDRLNALNL